MTAFESISMEKKDTFTNSHKHFLRNYYGEHWEIKVQNTDSASIMDLKQQKQKYMSVLYIHTHTHTQDYSAIKKERNLAICDNTDGPGGLLH